MRTFCVHNFGKFQTTPYFLIYFLEVPLLVRAFAIFGDFEPNLTPLMKS